MSDQGGGGGQPKSDEKWSGGEGGGQPYLVRPKWRHFWTAPYTWLVLLLGVALKGSNIVLKPTFRCCASVDNRMQLQDDKAENLA